MDADSVGNPTKGLDLNLLSPPLSAISVYDAPFKPAESDQTSLSMKKRLRRHRRSQLPHRPCGVASVHSCEGVATENLLARRRRTSISVPDLRAPAVPFHHIARASQVLTRQELQALYAEDRRVPNDISIRKGRRASVSVKSRRWTMPSKAVSTWAISTLPVVAASTAILSGDNRLGYAGMQSATEVLRGIDTHAARHFRPSETPAMITLKRATSKKRLQPFYRRTSLRPNSLISFPAPKFKRTTSTYLSSFFGLESQNRRAGGNEIIRSTVQQSSWSAGQDAVRSLQPAAVSANKVQLSTSGVAAPAMTQVEVQPLVHSPVGGRQPRVPSPKSRRCSTMVISGSSIHEIIWDENVISSSEGSCVAETSRQASCDSISKPAGTEDAERNSSGVIDKLEEQLRKHDQGKADSESHNGSRNTRLPSAAPQSRKSIIFTRLPFLDSNGGSGNSSIVNMAGGSRRTSSRVDLQPHLSQNFTTASIEHLACVQHADRSLESIEPSGFFPPLGESAGNTDLGYSLSGDVTWSNENNNVVEEADEVEPLTKVSPKSIMVDQSTKTASHERRRSTRHIVFESPRRSEGHVTAGAALGQSTHVRRKSRAPTGKFPALTGGRVFSRIGFATHDIHRAGNKDSRESDRTAAAMPLLGSVEHTQEASRANEGCESCASASGKNSVDGQSERDADDNIPALWPPADLDDEAGRRSNSGSSIQKRHQPQLHPPGIFSRRASVQSAVDHVEAAGECGLGWWELHQQDLGLNCASQSGRTGQHQQQEVKFPGKLVSFQLDRHSNDEEDFEVRKHGTRFKRRDTPRFLGVSDPGWWGRDSRPETLGGVGEEDGEEDGEEEEEEEEEEEVQTQAADVTARSVV